MLWTSADLFLLYQMRPWLVFRLHLITKAILISLNLVFDIFLFLLVIFVEIVDIFKLLSKLDEYGMISQIWKLHSFLGIHHKYSFEEILHLGSNIFKFLLLCYCRLQIKTRVIASPVYLCLHIMAFEGILGEEHKVEKDAHSPYVNRDPIVWVTYDLWCHVFLCTTMGFGPSTSDGSCETKIRYFVPNIIRVFVFVIFL